MVLCEGVLMVSYQLAPEQQDLRDSVAQFAREVVAPVIGGYYERGEFPYDIVARMGKLGLFGLPFPEEYGGATRRSWRSARERPRSSGCSSPGNSGPAVPRRYSGVIP
jgi:alkylation response protein AidB-like acyl-CoA dehydrogenase